MTLLPGPGPEEWDRLAEQQRNVFLTRAWADCWWRTHGGPGTPLVVADEGAGRWVVPLYVTRGPVRQVRFIGHGVADRLGPACAPADVPGAVEAVRRALRRRGGWDVAVLHDVPLDERWQDVLGAGVLRQEASPFVRLPTRDWDAFLATRSKNFREQLRRRERKLRGAFGVDVRLSTPETLPDDLTALFRLHRARWGDEAPFASGLDAQFHRAFAAVALAAGWLRLWVLELDGTPRAALLGYRFGGVESFYQSGRDPAFEEHSVGSVLLMHALRAALEDGVTEYHLLRGDEAYKSRLADGDRPLHTLVHARTLRGHAAARLALSRRR